MSRFTSKNLMISVLPEEYGVELMAGTKSCNPGGGCCTNPSGKTKPKVADDDDLETLRDQLLSLSN
jgi:hypothetical protein